MKWLLWGLVRGALLGLVVGAVFALVDWAHHMHGTKLVLGACVGVAVGTCVGRPIWKAGAGWHGLLKGLAGLVLGLGLVQVAYWLEPTGFMATRLTSNYLGVGGVLGAAWGAVVGWDDGC
jgi:hypothetical protein